MAEFPSELRYAQTHEWARLDDDGLVTVGITDHAQDQLGDVVYVELPELEIEVDQGQEAGVVESVKAASDLYAPVTGRVVAVNSDLEETPELVNQDPYGNGWFYKIDPRDTAELDKLLTADQYAEVAESDEH